MGACFLRSAVAVLVAWLLLGGAPAEAQSGGRRRDEIATCVARTIPGGTPAGMLAHAGAFDCTTAQTAFGGGDFWVLSAPLARHLTGEPLRVRVASLWQDRLSLYVRYADGAVVAAPPLDSAAAARHLRLGGVIETVLPARRSSPARLLWKVEGAANVRGVLIDARVTTAAGSARSDLTMAAIYAAFAGLATALLLHNLVMWRALRQPFQLAYCAMVASLLIYTLSSSGVLAWIAPWMTNNDRMRVNGAMMGLVSTAALAFARTFFEARVVAGWLGRIGTLVSVWILGATLALCACAPWHIRLLDRVFSIAILALLLVAVPLLWRAWRLRSSHLWLFAFAWGAPIALTTARVLHNLGLFRWASWLDHSTIASMAAEALLSSLAITYRLRLLTEERDDLRSRELAARLLADTDPLTGLANRRAFLRQAIGREGEQALLIVDVDHFKAVNDTLGHDGGDEVLRVIARTLRQSVSGGALVARIGGEEFAILSAAGHRVDPDAILSRLRAARMPFDLTVTASIGACTGPLGDERAWKALYRHADQALYEAKASGRDRTRRAPALVAA